MRLGSFVLSLLLLSSGFTIVAQTSTQSTPVPPPPPPPLIYSAPSPDQFQEFTSTEHGFAITFPGKPTEKKSTEQGVDLNIITFNRAGSVSSVLVTYFNTNIATHSTIESFRNQIMKLQGTTGTQPKIERERYFEVAGRTAHEFVYSHDVFLTRHNLIFDGNRIVQIVISVTNYSFLKRANKEILEAFNAEADRFVSSFRFVPSDRPNTK